MDYALWIVWLCLTALPASTTSPATPQFASPARSDIRYLETLAYLLAGMAFACLPRVATMETSMQQTGVPPPAQSKQLSTALTTTQPTEQVSAHIASISARSAATPQPAAPATPATPIMSLAL